MSLGQTVRGRVVSLAPLHDRLEQVIAQEGAMTVRCEIAGSERLGCALASLEMVDETPGEMTPAELLEHAESACRRINYLIEPLAPIEFDQRRREVMVRSRPPRMVEGRVNYFELLASAHRVTLRRFCFVPDHRRRTAVDIVLTHDQLGMLLDDLTYFCRTASE